MIVGYQGEPGAFSEEAIAAKFGAVDARGFATFDALLEAAADERVDLALLPCENSIHGAIARSYDLLSEHVGLRIVGETTHRIVQHLIGTSGATVAGLTTIRSHPVAIDQCRAYLKRLPGVAVEPALDTAGAVREIVADGDPRVAAIASAASAERYGAQVLESAIQDEAENFTRFFVVGKGGAAVPASSRACLAFTLSHSPGSLHAALGYLAEAGANLRSLVTRPLVGRPFEYRFYAEIEGISGAEATGLAQRLDPQARILGSYPCETTLTGSAPPGILP